MDGPERWEALMRSIRKACHILNREVPHIDYYNWDIAVREKQALWALVNKRRKHANQKR